jgi:hypothetical protein
MFKFEEKRHVIDAGRTVTDFLVWDIEIMGEFDGRALNRMAKTHLPDRRVFLGNRPGIDRHGIHILQHDGVRADGQHVLADLPQMRHGAKTAHDAADAERIGNGLAQAIFARHLEIGDRAGLVPADLEGDDDEIRAAC